MIYIISYYKSRILTFILGDIICTTPVITPCFRGFYKLIKYLYIIIIIIIMHHSYHKVPSIKLLLLFFLLTGGGIGGKFSLSISPFDLFIDKIKDRSKNIINIINIVNI